MRTIRLIPCCLIALLVTAAPALAQDRALKVGTANPYRIYTQIRESQDFQQKLETEKQAILTQDNQKQLDIRKLADDRRQYKPDHPRFAELSQSIEKANAEYNVWKELATLDQARKQKVRFLATYKKIEEAVGVVAEREKIDLVLSTGPKEFPATVEGMDFRELDNLIGARKIMYSKNIPDISEKVIAILDAEYAKAPKN